MQQQQQRPTTYDAAFFMALSYLKEKKGTL